jgi:hypothetical protein
MALMMPATAARVRSLPQLLSNPTPANLSRVARLVTALRISSAEESGITVEF